MTVVDEASKTLHEIEPRLRERTKGGIDSLNLAQRLGAVVDLLSREEPRWIGTAKAKHLLALDSEKYVKAWARAGTLRSRALDTPRTSLPCSVKQNLSPLGLARETVIQGLIFCRPSGRVSIADALTWAAAHSTGIHTVHTFDQGFLSEGIDVRVPH